MKKESKFIVIDVKAILVVFGIIAAIMVAYFLKTLLIAIFIATIIALGLEPGVEYLNRKKISRGAAVAIVYVAFIISLIGISVFAFSPIVDESKALGRNFGTYLENISNIPELEGYSVNINDEITKRVSSIGSQAVQTTISAFSGLLMSVTVLVLTAYLLLDFENVRKNLLSLVPKPNRENAAKILTKIEVKLGMWLRGQIALMVIIGVVTYVGLSILDVNYALPLAVIAALLEIVPIIGPIISVVPALIVGFGDSSFKGIGVLGLYIIIQQLENNFVVPKIMQKAVGMNPLVTMIAILIGGNLLGILGAVIAVPVTLIAQTIIKSAYKNLY